MVTLVRAESSRGRRPILKSNFPKTASKVPTERRLRGYPDEDNHGVVSENDCFRAEVRRFMIFMRGAAYLWHNWNGRH